MSTERHYAYQFLLEIALAIRGLTVERKVWQETIVFGGGLQRRDLGNTTTVKNLDWVNFVPDILEGLSTGTKLFALEQLFTSVKKYNLLWHYPTPTKRTEKIALKELTEAKVLFRTEVPGMYVINPIKVWKGNPVTCVEATIDIIREYKKPSPELVRDLKPKSEYIRTPQETYALLGADLVSNLLKEDETGYLASSKPEE